MPSLRILSPLLALAAAGCAQGPMPARPSGAASAVLDEVAQTAAAQVKRCYRSPRVASSGKQISTRLLVRFREDGGLAALPVVISQSGVTPANGPYASKMAEAAGLAVMRCTPIRLPLETYERGWRTLELTFSPVARA